MRKAIATGVCGLLLAWACVAHAQDVAPRIKQAQFSGDTLTLEFDQPMATWSGTSAFAAASFDPPLACTWSWSDDVTLVCRPGEDDASKPQPATRYRIALGGGLWSQAGVELDAQQVSAETQAPQISNFNLAQWHDGWPRIQLRTNLPVEHDSLRDALTVTLNDAALAFDVVALSSEHTQWLLRPLDTTRAGLLVVTQLPGLRTPLGELPGKIHAELLRAVVAEPFNLRRVACSVEITPALRKAAGLPEEEPHGDVARAACPAGANIAFEFSDALSTAALAAFRAALPAGVALARTDAALWWARGTDKTLRRPGQVIYVTLEQPQQTFAWTVPPTLASAAGATLQLPVRVVLRSGDLAPSLSAQPPRLVVRAGDDTLPRITATNMPKLAVTQHLLGAGAPIAQTASMGTRRRNVRETLALPRIPRDARDSGALVDGNVGPHEAIGVSAANYAVSYAAFDVSASEAGAQVLAWVTQWDGAAAIGGAMVELLRVDDHSTLHVLATALTDADGVAVLARPREADENAPSGMLLLRATSKGRRAILPLWEALADVREGYQSFANVHDGNERSWGVSDRALYRAGETVHYRIWTRQRDANHLRAPLPGVRTFALVSLFGDARITEFDAEADRFGSVSGAFRLPPTLRDDNYCIAPKGHPDDGACFRVTGYHVNDMWAELHADGSFAHEGDTLALDASAGYFSGGPAADVPAKLRAVLQYKRLEEAYPKFAAYTFAGLPLDAGGQDFDQALPTELRTDSQGHARARIELRADDAKKPDAGELIPFGTVFVDASIGSSGANAATSAPLEITFSRHPRYAGIKVEPQTLRDDADPEVDALVISERGAAVSEAPVSIDILEMHADPALAPNAMTPGAVLAHCEVRSGHKAACPFRAPRSGVYRFRASSDGAAAATLDRYAFVGAATPLDATQAPHARLTVANAVTAAGDSARLVLEQPFAKAQVLFSVEHGHVLKHWCQQVDRPVASIALPIPAEWAPGVTVHATVLDASSDPFGHRAPLTDIVQGASVDIHVDAPKRAAPLALELAPGEVHPGGEIAFTLRNHSPHELQLTVSVVDDASLALVPEYVTAADPAGDKWLGLLKRWDQTWWYSLGDWPREPAADALIDPHPQAFWPGATYAQRGQALDTIVVTGSNIRRVDVYSRAPAITHAFAFLPHGSNRTQGAVRAHFSESALWDADSTLAAGAARTVRVRLPDNLTRWRVMVWANDVDDAFTLVQTTLAASLPVEVRHELPARLFPGDVALLGASVRNHGDAARTLQMRIAASGAGVSASAEAGKPLAPHAQARLTVLARPLKPGSIEVETRAADARGGDALAASVEVASPVVRERVPVAGWLPAQGVTLALPPLPAGASQAQLRVEAANGLNAFAKTWIVALRDYPHRCWEQILSRAVGAAAAKRLDLAAAWPNADEAVEDALRVAGQYQDAQGQFVFFASTFGTEVSAPNPFLTAYTVRAFGFLRRLGYRIPQDIDDKARTALDQAVRPGSYPGERQSRVAEEFASMAELASADVTLDPQRLDAAWRERADLSWTARAGLARALARRPAETARAHTALEELRSAGMLHGLQRVVGEPAALDWPFASAAVDQCEVAAALADLDDSAQGRRLRDEYLRGIADLYAGGGNALGTQASARCLMTLVRVAAASAPARAVRVQVGGAASGAFEIAPDAVGAWQAGFPATPAKLELHADAERDALLSYVANVEYDVDARHAQPSAVGLSIDRSYAVLRNKHWQRMPAAVVHEGDWVQVTLRVSTQRVRHFVAITDSVAGGLRPTDLDLAGVADLELRRLATPPDPYFSEHQIDDRFARFYAEQVSAGTHELHYYARAAHRGSYGTLPAVAELMYGPASVARTAAGTVHIVK